MAILCYQVATPDVRIAPSVTAFQGDFEASLGTLAGLGYDGVELMTLDPRRLDRQAVKEAVAARGLSVPLVCTGEIFGQLGVTMVDEDLASREKAIRAVKDAVDFAAFLGANVNIGRVRGQYRPGAPNDMIYRLAVESLREICRYAERLNVRIALENVTIMQTNFLNTVGEAARMADDVGMSNCGIMMDVFHMNIEEKDVLRSIRDYSDYTVHVHLADNNRRYPGHCGMDFSKIIGAFYDSHYDGAFAVEVFQIPDQLTAARGAIEHLAPILNKVYGRAG